MMKQLMSHDQKSPANWSDGDPRGVVVVVAGQFVD